MFIILFLFLNLSQTWKQNLEKTPIELFIPH